MSAASERARVMADARRYLAGELDELAGEVGYVERAVIYPDGANGATWIELDLDCGRVDGGRIGVDGPHSEPLSRLEEELTLAEAGELARAYGVGS